MTKLRVTTTLKIVQMVDVNENTYPGMTPEEARQFELVGRDVDEQLVYLTESIQYADFESDTAYPHGKIGIEAEIINLD